MAEHRRRRRAPTARRTPVDPARRAALEVLVAVRAEGAYTNLVLPHVLRRRGLTGRDAAFVTELASGTIRRQGTYDAVLAACVDRPLAKVQSQVLDALRLGSHQLLAMRVADHAAISTTVDLVRDRAGAGAGGFANAVLRRVAGHDLDAWMSRLAPDPDTDPVGHAALVHAHPRWVVDELAAALAAGRGGQPTDLAALLAADNDPPRVTLVARPGAAGLDELEPAGGTRSRLSPYGFELAAGDPGAIAAVAEGRAGVQDEGSQLVALTLATAELDGADRRWLDLCAGPGGKSALLGAVAAGRDARLLASERQAHRAGLVRAATRAVPGVLGVLTADGTRPAWRPGMFDRVLVDAPCTGLGALRRRPEARWRRTREDLAALVPLQRRLLSSALDSVRPGGVVLYATCSPVLAETVEVVEGVLGERPDGSLGDARTALVAAARPDADLAGSAGPLPGTVQLWPHRHGTDAMFMALLRRG